MAWEYITVGLLGLAVGVGELFTRYRDAPWLVLRRRAGLAYLAINAVAGMAAFAAIRLLNLRIGAADGPVTDGEKWGLLLLAGFSAMALLRSSVFTLRVGQQDIPTGPAAVLKAILDVLDRAVDRDQADRRDQFVDTLPADWLPDAGGIRNLSSYCLALMQNVTPDEQKALGLQIDQLVNDRGLTPRQRLRLACLLLLPVTGADVLGRAVARVRQDDSPDQVPDPPPLPPS